MAEILLVTMGGEGPDAMANLLREAGYSVSLAIGFRQALDALASGSPDLLISAIRLGDYNGLHLVLRSQSTHAGLRTILFDHVYDSPTESASTRYGASHFVH